MRIRTGPIPTPDQDAKLKPNDFSDVLWAVPSDCVLIGGQAVAWWAARFGLKSVVGSQEHEVTSRDIDLAVADQQDIHDPRHRNSACNCRWDHQADEPRQRCPTERSCRWTGAASRNTGRHESDSRSPTGSWAMPAFSARSRRQQLLAIEYGRIFAALCGLLPTNCRAPERRL